VKRYLLDTGIAGDYLNRRHGVFEWARQEVASGNKIGISIPVLGELWYGVENSATRERNVALLRRNLSHWKIWPFTEAAAEEFGRLLAELQRLGRPIGRIDAQIAAIALTLGNTTVVSKDSDLAAVPGLKVENWVAAAT
jgi:tRNA(fMet)-specific endonuclease VapC